MYDIIIVGAGPAGLTAAIYALRAKKKVLIFEAKSYGGQITTAALVENYPGLESISGFDFATNLYNQVLKLGAEIKFETVLKIEEGNKVTTKKGEYEAKAIILATGADKKKLNLAKEEMFAGRGISYCATCDGSFYKDKVVAVVGGGNAALEDALYLADLASKVYLIHRRDEFRADQYVKELEEKGNVEFIYDSNVVNFNGTNKLESIDIQNKDGEVTTLAVDGLFVAVGQEPKNQIFANIIDLDEAGYIKTEDGVHTSKPKIYVAGDARPKMLKQLVTATSDGAIAATTAIKEMNA